MSVVAAAETQPFWPEFHGPKRDNISPETGLLKQWPEDGPKLLWKFTGCGQGYAGVSIAGGLLFTTGDFGAEERVIAIDLDGKLKWQKPNGRSWTGPQPGARTTPTYSDGLVYQLNAHGVLSAFVAATGEVRWSTNLVERFSSRVSGWGFTENVIIDGDKVFVTLGGQAGKIVALNKKNGISIWANTEIQDTQAYSSPIIVTHGGVKQMIALTHESVVSVDVETGKLLWTHKHPSTCDQNVTSPVFHDGGVYVTSGHKAGGRMFRVEVGRASLAATDTQAGAEARPTFTTKEAWFGVEQDNCHGGVVYVDGYLYGSGCRLYKRGLVCAEFASGKIMYNNQDIGKVSVTYADGRLYCLGNDASMALVDVSPKEAKIVSRFQPPWVAKPPCLSHPVICAGRLYIRHLDELFVYDIKQ
jgi:outer membrane protein assembly factor BamB